MLYSESSYLPLTLQALLCNIIKSYDCVHAPFVDNRIGIINVSTRTGLQFVLAPKQDHLIYLRRANV